jgi:type 2A phosphatase activator TIP41
VTSDDPAEVSEIAKPYDWTYTTDYMGSVEWVRLDTPDDRPVFTPTQQGIDYDRLRQREPILFFDNVVLFEDELADNGTAVLLVKTVCRPCYICCCIDTHPGVSIACHA